MKKHFFIIVAFLLHFTCVSLLAQNPATPIVMQPATSVSISVGSSLNISPASSNAFPDINYYNSSTHIDDALRNKNYVHELANNRFFHNENYHTGELWTKNGHYLKEMMYRIDQIEGAIQVKLPNGKEMYIDEKSIIMLHLFIRGKKFVFVSRDIPNKRGNALLQVVYYNPKLQLLRDSRKVIIETLISDKKKTTVKDEGVKTIPSSNLRKYQTINEDIKNDFRYYITEDDNKPLKEIQLNEASLSQIFPDHMTTIVQFFKDNTIKDELDQVKLVKLLDKITFDSDKSEK